MRQTRFLFRQGRACFNSLKVRLNEQMEYFPMLIYTCFNSLKVRLNVAVMRAGGPLTPMFQFLKGAIKCSLPHV